MRGAATYLEHLDKGDTEVEIGLVTADQTHAEEDADRDNRSQINTARHGHLLSRVEDGGEAGEDLGHDGGEDQMPCCEEDREVCLWRRSVCAFVVGLVGRRTELGRVEDVLVEDDCAGAEGDPCAGERLAGAGEGQRGGWRTQCRRRDERREAQAPTFARLG